MVNHSKKTYMLVACDYGPVGNGRQIELAVAGMVAAGHRVCVVLLSSGGGLATRLQAVGATVCVVNERSAVRVLVTFHVAKIIRNEQPQVVIVNEATCPRRRMIILVKRRDGDWVLC